MNSRRDIWYITYDPDVTPKLSQKSALKTKCIGKKCEWLFHIEGMYPCKMCGLFISCEISRWYGAICCEDCDIKFYCEMVE